MQNEILHLPLSAAVLTAPFSQKLSDAFITSCKLLDVVPFASLVDQEDVFEDQPIHQFLDGLLKLFKDRRRELVCPFGYRFLAEQYTSVCLGCGKGRAPVVIFKYRTLDGKYLPTCDLAYRIIWEEGILLDIFQCIFYNGCGIPTCNTT